MKQKKLVVKMEKEEILKKLKALSYLIKNLKKVDLEILKVFVKDYYNIEFLSLEFYELLKNKLNKTRAKRTLKIMIKSDIYELISHLKFNNEPTVNLKEYLTPEQYLSISKHSINKIIIELKKLPDEENKLFQNTKDELLWKLKRIPKKTNYEYLELAYKIYQVIGLENAMEFLSGKYGNITYEQVHFMFKNIDIIKLPSKMAQQSFINFLFSNKKSYNNIIRQMLEGNFNELFLNFDYFYNNIEFFINKLGTRLSKSKVKDLINNRFISHDVSTPEITNDLLDDMLSSYYCKYETLDTPKDEVYCRNYEAYKNYLKNKYQSSIPRIPVVKIGDITAEVLKLNDPRNLVLGYRAGNCFRINGDAGILFNEFLKSEHMRLLSLSTDEYKDFAMMLIMRNGNVLIGQGIEISKRVPSDFNTKKIYEICKQVLKEMMEYANSNNDEIIATIIGSSNSNVSSYNKNILPFLVSPILESTNTFYNGIYNYQCLLDIMPSKTLYDIKLYKPEKRYLDERESIFARDYSQINYDEYLEMEKRLRALRFSRLQEQKDPEFYTTLIEKDPVYIACNREWYVTLYTDGTIDSYISSHTDPRIKEEYNAEIEKVYKKINKPNKA